MPGAWKAQRGGIDHSHMDRQHKQSCTIAWGCPCAGKAAVLTAAPGTRAVPVSLPSAGLRAGRDQPRATRSSSLVPVLCKGNGQRTTWLHGPDSWDLLPWERGWMYCISKREYWPRSSECQCLVAQTAAVPGPESSPGWCRGFSPVAQDSSADFPSTLFRIP